jgi:hypothetical protein
MNVIPLDRARPRPRTRRPVEPPPALGNVARLPRPANAPSSGEDRLRMRQNLAAIAVVMVIVVLGGWLISNLQYYSHLQACVEAGHRNCLPLEPKYLPSPYGR